jgi:hypothetical protein
MTWWFILLKYTKTSEKNNHSLWGRKGGGICKFSFISSKQTLTGDQKRMSLKRVEILGPQVLVIEFVNLQIVVGSVNQKYLNIVY